MNCLCYPAAILHSELLPILYDKDWNCYASILVDLVQNTASYMVDIACLTSTSTEGRVCVGSTAHLLRSMGPVSLLRSSAAAPGLHAPSTSEKTVHALS